MLAKYIPGGYMFREDVFRVALAELNKTQKRVAKAGFVVGRIALVLN